MYLLHLTYKGAFSTSPFLGQPVVVINSAEAARDLMGKRGLRYSSWPEMVALGVEDMCVIFILLHHN